ncbi:MAG: bifunctional acetate--CoA ligase family protein/GNAT family N-acetyltransferase [Wenzhouxiangellaceae bacterium]|nr:bifunctional acetate--CoA ligase family protein/GNAT family N-acetyltransferase [Wenzhouxiangellaceae bacterium]
MAPHFLTRILAPASIAVFGASDRPGSTGQVVFANLIDGGFAGDLFPINTGHDRVQGREAFADLDALDRSVDLAVVATPAETVPGILRQCGEHGVRGAIVLSAGFAELGEPGREREREIVAIAREHGVRLIGPNCLGIIRPDAGVNATFSNNRAEPGPLALISQSGAICTAVLDWAATERIGFSAVISMGNTADVGFGDALDFLALDRRTRSILVYLEGIHDVRRFMSGLRAAARVKPVVLIKPGRHAESSAAAMSHTGSLVGADDVFDAALERTGAVRAMTISQLFSAARMLSGARVARGNRLAVVTNAGGPAVMAADRAAELGLRLAELEDSTLAKLDQTLPEAWSHANPVDVLGDAGPGRFEDALAACLGDPGVDAAIVMATPQAMTDAGQVAEATARLASAGRKPVLGCWMGAGQVQAAREVYSRHGLPHFSTPEAAVEAFGYMAAYRRNQRLLLQVPGPLTDHAPADLDSARSIVGDALAGGRDLLNAMEAKALLQAFRIPATRTWRAGNRTEAVALARTMGFPVVLKIDSPDITHKSDVDGVRLNVDSERAVEREFDALLANARRLAPEAGIVGVTVERMHRSNFGRELMIGVMRDAVFGPVITFGSGGTSVEVLRDRAVALPPLNEVIIEAMIARTRIARMLKRFRNMPAIDEKALEQVLLRVSEMVCEMPELVEMDINPLIVDERGLVAVDSRIRIAPARQRERYSHMAIHPYPAELVGEYRLTDGTRLTVRPIRPEDATIEQAFVRNLSEESRYFRFMQQVSELTPQLLVRFTQIDYDREMALIAVDECDDEEVQVAVVRYTVDPDETSCEFALAVADEWQGRGVGYHLMLELMKVARARRLERIHGEVLAANRHMLGLMKRLEFRTRTSPDDTELKLVERPLDDSLDEL